MLYILLIVFAVSACTDKRVAALGDTDSTVTDSTVVALPELPPKLADSSAGGYRYIVRWDGKPVRCESHLTATFPLPYLKERDGWYGKQLRATGQGSLCAERDPPEQVYRLTWLPSFHPAVMVRVEKRRSSHTLFAVRLSGAGGYEAGRPSQDTTILLSSADWEGWLTLVAAARFWEATTAQSDSVIGPDGKVTIMMGTDGAQWLLEARRGQDYHAVDRWSPHDEQFVAFRKACEWLLHRSGLVDSALVANY